METPAPTRRASQALVEVHTVALNFGELAFLSRMRKPGEIPAWDAAGVVIAAAEDGSGAEGPHFGRDLVYLLGLVARGELDPQISWRGSWERASEAASAVLERKVNGKAVLDVRGGSR